MADEALTVVQAGKPKVNVRKALAGLYLLDGRGDLKTCLVQAGFSPATARNPTEKGLGAEGCLAEAAKWDEDKEPATLLSNARARFAQGLALMDPAKTPLREIVKAVDTAEKYYGGHEISAGHALTSLADRLTGMVALLAVARERGLPVPAIPASYLEAEVVATSSESVRPDNVDAAVSSDGTET